MSNGMSIAAAGLMMALVVLGIASCTMTVDACKRAGGIPQYEYKQLPSCWTRDGRRLFPEAN